MIFDSVSFLPPRDGWWYDHGGLVGLGGLVLVAGALSRRTHAAPTHRSHRARPPRLRFRRLAAAAL